MADLDEDAFDTDAFDEDAFDILDAAAPDAEVHFKRERRRRAFIVAVDDGGSQ